MHGIILTLIFTGSRSRVARWTNSSTCYGCYCWPQPSSCSLIDRTPSDSECPNSGAPPTYPNPASNHGASSATRVPSRRAYRR